MKLWNAVRHFRTITKHKQMVMENCFKVGLYKQGLLHDLSKYSWEEFRIGVKYYQGDRSPNAAEKEEKGYSVAWLHHKGRNKHHFEYWIDFAPDKSAGLIGNEMPLKYLVEMVMDRIAASKVYKGDAYTDACPWEYYARGQDYAVMHKKTRAQLEKLLLMLKDEGEEKTFAYIRKLLRHCALRARAPAVNKTGLEFKKRIPALSLFSYAGPVRILFHRINSKYVSAPRPDTGRQPPLLPIIPAGT